jgi:ADP-dependent NAD(P)H-hydrate dehydratase / NAD(P)H-hydrate epimerase
VRLVLTPAEMAEADRRAIEAGTPETELVERAGRSVARHAVRMLGGSYGRRVVIVCGKGNNGADGRVAARVLRSKGVGVDEIDAEGFSEADFRALLRADLAIDAMYGTGFRGELTGTPAAVANQLESLGLPVLAVDIPSGVRGATGAVEFVAVRATETICFAAYKPGLLFEPGRSHAGRIEVVDIGIGVDNGATLCVLEVDDLSLPEPEPDEHKWSSGCLVVGGSNGMVGAPVLAGRAALRTGAGMVVCAVPGSNAAANVSGHELVARVLPATDDGSLDQGAADEVLEEVARYRVVAIGPGLGRDPATQAAVRAIVADAGVPLVIDADALNAVAVDPSVLQARHAAGHPLAVLTPHAGEYERLAGRPVGEDRVAAARTLAAELQAIVVLKGPGTVIATPWEAAVVNPTGGPALATAGTGDVLTGVIAALVARGAAPFHAASTGAYVHGRAAELAPDAPHLVASDLVAALPRTLRELRNRLDSGGSA